MALAWNEPKLWQTICDSTECPKIVFVHGVFKGSCTYLNIYVDKQKDEVEVKCLFYEVNSNTTIM
jgi:hypothetical protein